MEYCLIHTSTETFIYHKERGLVFSGTGNVDLRAAFQQSGVLGDRKILSLIPSSMCEEEIHAHRNMLFRAGIHQEALLPLNIALSNPETPSLVVSSTSDLCDISIVENNEIIAGGTIDSLQRNLATALETLVEAPPELLTEARDELVSFFPTDARKFFLSPNSTLDSRDFYPLAAPIFERLVQTIKRIDTTANSSPIILWGKPFDAPGVAEFFMSKLGRRVQFLSCKCVATRLGNLFK